jgi:dihydrofolate reductase
MATVRVGTTISLDGYSNDPSGSVSQLYPDLAAMRQTEWLQEEIRTTGAAVMGRRAYDMAQGDLTGYEFQVPIFVLTHHVPEQPPRGQNDNLKVFFVTEGIASAIEQARAAAGERVVQIIGGANTAQQCLAQGLADEIQIGFAPLLLGGGLRFFEHLEQLQLNLEIIKVYQSSDRTDIRYRILQ